MSSFVAENCDAIPTGVIIENLSPLATKLPSLCLAAAKSELPELLDSVMSTVCVAEDKCGPNGEAKTDVVVANETTCTVGGDVCKMSMTSEVVVGVAIGDKVCKKGVWCLITMLDAAL